jgi:hypothetical protein
MDLVMGSELRMEIRCRIRARQVGPGMVTVLVLVLEAIFKRIPTVTVKVSPLVFTNTQLPLFVNPTTARSRQHRPLLTLDSLSPPTQQLHSQLRALSLMIGRASQRRVLSH